MSTINKKFYTPYHASWVRALNSLPAAVVLKQAILRYDRAKQKGAHLQGKERCDFFCEATGLTRREIDAAFKLLAAACLVTYEGINDDKFIYSLNTENILEFDSEAESRYLKILHAENLSDDEIVQRAEEIKHRYNSDGIPL